MLKIDSRRRSNDRDRVKRLYSLTCFMPTFDLGHPFFAFFAEASVPIKVGIFFGVWVTIWLPIAIPLAIALQWHPF